MTEIDLTLNSMMIPALSNFQKQFGTVVDKEVNKGGLTTAQVNTNVLMAFSKMRPVPVGASATTTRIEYDAKLVFNKTNEAPCELILGEGGYIGCCVTIYNVSDYSCVIKNEFEENIFEDSLERNGYGKYCWNGLTWVKMLTKISIGKPTVSTIGDIWFDV
jgi:hypothetical protein